MNILIFGHTGMLGKALIEHWQNKHIIYGISRKKGASNHVQNFSWEQLDTLLDNHKIDIAINLCGESIGQLWHPWSRKKIYDSRVQTTKYVVDHIKHKPIHLINASGVGIYPSTTQLTQAYYSEQTIVTRSNAFLQQLAYDWEQAALMHENTTLLRTAVVIKKNDGVLNKLIMGHQFKLLTQLGSGNNPFPWVAIEDWCRAVDFIINKKILGPINLTSPQLSSYNDIMNMLCKSINAYKFTLPDVVVKSLLGEMGDALFLTGSAAVPEKLENLGFEFKYGEFSKLET